MIICRSPLGRTMPGDMMIALTSMHCKYCVTVWCTHTHINACAHTQMQSGTYAYLYSMLVLTKYVLSLILINAMGLGEVFFGRNFI